MKEPGFLTKLGRCAIERTAVDVLEIRSEIEAEIERLQTAAMNYAQSPAGYNPTANDRYAAMRHQRARVLNLVREAIAAAPVDAERGVQLARLAGRAEAARELAPHLVEILQLCAAGDVDETTSALGWGDAIARAKDRLAAFGMPYEPANPFAGMDADADGVPASCADVPRPAAPLTEKKIGELWLDLSACGVKLTLNEFVNVARLVEQATARALGVNSSRGGER